MKILDFYFKYLLTLALVLMNIVGDWTLWHQVGTTTSSNPHTWTSEETFAQCFVFFVYSLLSWLGGYIFAREKANEQIKKMVKW